MVQMRYPNATYGRVDEWMYYTGTGLMYTPHMGEGKLYSTIQAASSSSPFVSKRFTGEARVIRLDGTPIEAIKFPKSTFYSINNPRHITDAERTKDD